MNNAAVKEQKGKDECLPTYFNKGKQKKKMLPNNVSGQINTDSWVYKVHWMHRVVSCPSMCDTNLRHRQTAEGWGSMCMCLSTYWLEPPINIQIISYWP